MMHHLRTFSIGLTILLATGAAGARAADEGTSPVPPLPAAAREAAPPARGDAPAPAGDHKDPVKLLNKNSHCIECHENDTPAIFEQWVASTHARAGVGCDDCHGANKGEKGAFLHAGKFYITTVVTPVDCANCHKGQYLDYTTSGHALALELLQEMKEDNPRFPVVSLYKEGDFQQCRGCHGGTVEVDGENRPDPAAWPDSGAGRVNPNSSRGNCGACHLGHVFSAAAARQPETCLRCHDGANYPEGGIYRASAHGVLYETAVDKENLTRPGFYLDGRHMGSPTCAFCHLNGSGQGRLTRHNPAWNLPRDLTSPAAPLAKRAENLRGNMKATCNQCHAAGLIDRFFANADKELERYQQNTVEPQLADYRQKLTKAKGEERRALLQEYTRFLAEAKRFRMNLYMGQHGRSQR
jgi:hypothetical protein